MFKKVVFLFVCMLLFVVNASAAIQASSKDPRSDSLDVIHTHISLDITDFANQYIRGNARLHIKPRRSNLRHIFLDLLRMQIDSVSIDGTAALFTYNDTLLHVYRNSFFPESDTLSVTVFYRGQPQADATWGGFYFQSGIAYNLGVGFSSVPHNLGRAWFPCFDNFTERFTVSTSIKTLSNHKAFCGGIITSVTDNGDGTKTWNSSLSQTIPSYLVSVAVGPFVSINGIFSGINGTIPFEHGMIRSDSLRFVNSFVNLETCFDFFESRFGAYPFSKVGYVVVPFSGGAMEHATNIAYSRALVNGLTTNECEYMAHELAHMWFGDKVTCRTAQDMWLNEGWATFCGSLFKELQQGRQAYNDELKNRHDQVLRFANYKEGGYLALSDVPEQFTYGDHAYNKGADVAHSLRGFLGDTLFFTCVKNYLQEFAFSDASSNDMQLSFEQTSGKNLQQFFDAFVYHGGFLDVLLDSFQVSGLGPYQVTVFTHQAIKGPAWACNNLPVTITLLDSTRHSQSFRITSNQSLTQFTVTSNVKPEAILVNEEQLLALAQTAVTKTISAPGALALAPVRFNMNVLSLSDTVLCKVTQHYVGPTGFDAVSGFRASSERYFSVEGIFPSGFRAKGSFIYDGRSFSTSSTQFLDNLLINDTEDSLFLFYRKNASYHWQQFPYYTKIMGSSTDKFGTMQIDSILPGDYVLAMKDETAAVHLLNASKDIEIHPNPAGESVMIFIPNVEENNELMVIDGMGRTIYQEKNPRSLTRINTAEWPGGFYILRVDGLKPEKFLIRH